MKIANFFLFFSVFVFSQSGPTSKIIEYSPKIKGIQIGTTPKSEHCYIWFHTPIPTQTQIACYAQDGTVLKNEILIPASSGAFETFDFPDGSVSWLITDSVFQLSARGTGDVTETFLKGTY